MSLKLIMSHPSDETCALKIVRERLSRQTKEVVEMLGELRVGHRTLRKVDQRINRVVTGVGQHGRLANFSYQSFETIVNEHSMLRLSHHLLRGLEICERTHMMALLESRLIPSIEKRCGCVSNKTSSCLESLPLSTDE
jgi:hypothetical protein